MTELDRVVAPAFSLPPSFELPKVTRISRSNGFDAFVFDQIPQELVKIELIFEAGRWQEPTPGVSYFTAHLLEKGTGKHNAQAIAEWFDRFGAHIEISSGADFSSISLYVLKKRLSNVLPLFTEMVTTPAFPESELELIKGIFKQNLRVNLEKNSFVASQLLKKNLFGPQHPYGSAVEEKDVDNITTTALSNFYKAHFRPSHLFVTGRLPSNTIDEILSIFNPKGNNRPPTSDHNVAPGVTHVYQDKKESIQTSIRMGLRTLNRNHNDYATLLLANHLLGGFFGSRLMKNIREEKGLTYGIYASVQPFVRDSIWVVGADVNKENLDLTIHEINHEINRLAQESPSQNELEAARNHFLGSLQLDMANPFSVVEKIKTIALNGLSQDFYSELFSRITAVTPNDISVITRSYFPIPEIIVAKVG